MKIKASIILLGAVLLTGCVEEYKTTTVKGTVIEKEHDEARSYYKKYTDSNGNKKRKLVKEEEEFEVVIKYKDIEKEFEFDDDDFYNTVKVSDTVDVQLVTGYDKGGTIVTQDIELKPY